MKFFEKKYINGKNLSSHGAFSHQDNVEFNLYIPRRCGVTSVYVHLFGEGIENKFYKKISLRWSEIDYDNDIYAHTLNMSELGVGLFYYKYEVVADEVFYLGEGDVSEELKVINEFGKGNIQLLVYEDRTDQPSWLYGSTMYQIFVDRFAKSGKCKPKSTAIINQDWYNGIPQFPDFPGAYVENNMFFGGDLYGVIEKLDYIQSLGVGCIYLCPIFDAYSNHKYDTADYMTIDSMFGSEEAFDLLLKEVKKRGMHLILDGVFNHTGADSVYFNKFGRYKSLGAFQSKQSPYYEWYNFKDYPNEYECWWDVKILPRVNSDCPSYIDYILGDGGVVEKWMKKGIDGFRLDVADELSDRFLQLLKSKVKSINPNGVVYGEVWEDASNKIAYDKRKKYFLGNELDSVMNYPVRTAVIEFIKNGDYRKFYDVCKTLYNHYPSKNANLLMNLLGTHDTERILTVLGGDSSEGLTNAELSVKKMTEKQRKIAKKLLKLAYVLIATLPGVPCIYYGDEIGMEGYRDPFNRMPFPWGKEDEALLKFFQKIGQIRAKEEVYKTGEYKFLFGCEDYLAFARHIATETVVTVVNRCGDKLVIDSDVPFVNLETNKQSNIVKPESYAILKFQKPVDEVVLKINK